MNKKVIVIDNFLYEPYEVRRHALERDYVSGDFNGMRSHVGSSPEVINKLMTLNDDERGLNLSIKKYNGSFEWISVDSKKEVKIKYSCTYAGILFLTPNAPINTGVSFYKHKETGLDCYLSDEPAFELVDKYGKDLTKWDEIDRIGNVFNRLVLYESKYYQSATNYFGEDIIDSRLSHIFYF